MDVTALAAIAGLVVVAGMAKYADLRRTELLHRTLQEALRSGSPVADQLIRKMEERSDRSDLVRGLMSLALATALVCFSFLIGSDADEFRIFVGLAMFPALVGLVLIGIWKTRRDRGR